MRDLILATGLSLGLAIGIVGCGDLEDFEEAHRQQDLKDYPHTTYDYYIYFAPGKAEGWLDMYHRRDRLEYPPAPRISQSALDAHLHEVAIEQGTWVKEGYDPNIPRTRERPPLTALLCSECYNENALSSFKKRYPQWGEYLNRKILTPPQERPYHKSTALRWNTITAPPPFQTSLYRQGEKRLMFIHKRKSKGSHVWVITLSRGTMTEETLRKRITTREGLLRVLCAQCFSKDDIAQLESKLNIKIDEWRRVDPNEWAD